jgi:hypothetical protein
MARGDIHKDQFPNLPRGGNLMRRLEQREPETPRLKPVAALAQKVAKIPAKKAAKKKGKRK